MPASTCPTCGYVMDDATCVTDASKRPKPGDVSVCMRCGEILAFSGTLNLSIAGVDHLLALDAEMNHVLTRTQELIRRQRPLGTVWPNTKVSDERH